MEITIDGDVKSEMNIILVQFAPIPRDKKLNIKKLQHLLSKYTENDKIDLILFPEMALTGYIFDSKEDVADSAEEYNKGETFEFCCSLAIKLKCYVFLGYPEKIGHGQNLIYYNSCMIVDKDGNSHPSYRKHFLYEMDLTWCNEGEDFGYIELYCHSGKRIRAGIGICMDLNPKEFKAPWEAMEFANFCRSKDVDVILFLTNWLDTNEDSAVNTRKETEYQVMHMINYWVMRLEPFWEDKNCYYKSVYFLAANRCGKERDTTFIGCSCAVRLGVTKPKLLANLNKNDMSTLLVKLKV